MKVELPVSVRSDVMTNVAAPLTPNTVEPSASLSVGATNVPEESVRVPPAAVTVPTAVKLNVPMANVPGKPVVSSVLTFPFWSSGKEVAPEFASMNVSVAEVGTPAPPAPPLVADQQKASLHLSPFRVQNRSSWTR